MSGVAVDPTWPRPSLQVIQRLVRENAALQIANAKLKETEETRDRRIARLLKEKKRLESKLEEAQRAGKRQASPFTKGDPNENPGRPGRKPGLAHGPTNLRPPPDCVDRHRFAAVPELCPCCGEPVVADDIDFQYVWDLPPIQPVITQFMIEIGHCRRGHRVQGRHPEQTSDALGSASCQIGPQALAVVAHLNKVVGAPFAKIAMFFKVVFHFVVAASTLVRAMIRMGKKLEPAYVEVRRLVRTSPVVYADETGWRICGTKAWLWVFVGIRPDGRKVVLYLIARYRGFSVAESVIGRNYRGILNHDGWAPYDRFLLATHQTCDGHLLVRCNRLLETATRRSVSFPRHLKALLQAAFQVRDRYRDGDVSAHGLKVVKGRLESRLDRLLEMDLTHPGNRRLSEHVRKHRDQVFTFLDHPDEVEGTNCFGEQETRPAVIARKISGCNKTWAGSHAHQVLTTLFRTAFHSGELTLGWLVAALREPFRRILTLPAFLGGSSIRTRQAQGPTGLLLPPAPAAMGRDPPVHRDCTVHSTLDPPEGGLPWSTPRGSSKAVRFHVNVAEP